MGRAGSARTRLTALGLSLAAAVLLVIPDGVAQDRWIIEPGPEAANAQAQGAAEVERAQKLAKAKQYAEAAAVLEALSRKLPAAVHDCNLALAYLRAGALTRAQLVWDLSGLRNGVRPKWCTGDVSTQLSTALRAAAFVPTTIDVVPADAVIEVGGVAMRGLRTVWLPAGPATISASATGRLTQTINATIAAPSTRVAITLEAPRPAEPDAGVGGPASTADAAASTLAVVDAAVPLEAPVGPSPADDRSRLPLYASFGVAVLGWLGAGTFTLLTVNAKGDANERYATDPMFESEKNRYDTFKWLTVGSIAVAAVATGLTVYFYTRDKREPAPGGVGVGVTSDGVGITFSGTFGGSR